MFFNRTILFTFLGLFVLYLQSQAAQSYGRQEEFSCPICSYSTTNVTALEVHVDRHLDPSTAQDFDLLENNISVCPLCTYVSTNATQLQDHVNRHLDADAPSENPSARIRGGPKAGQTNDIDDQKTFTKSVMRIIFKALVNSSDVHRKFINTEIDHYAMGDYDNGWGVGYRNIQIMLSAIFQNVLYHTTICESWSTYNLYRGAMPSILEIQRMINAAWTQGFDADGAQQFDHELIKTKKWLGATEVVALFRSLGIRSQLIDFHRPTSEDGGHPAMFEWVLKYFQQTNDPSPLLLQRQGFSQVIVGVEQRGSKITLITIDPTHNSQQMATLGRDDVHLVRHEMDDLRAEQYQILVIRGVFKDNDQKEASKLLRSVRIPDDDEPASK